MVRDVGQRGKWGGTGRLTANFSLLATPDGAANGRRTNAVMPNGHHSLRMPPARTHFPLFPPFPAPSHPLPHPTSSVLACSPRNTLSLAHGCNPGHVLPPFPFPHPTQTAIQERQKPLSVLRQIPNSQLGQERAFICYSTTTQKNSTSKRGAALRREYI